MHARMCTRRERGDGGPSCLNAVWAVSVLGMVSTCQHDHPALSRSQGVMSCRGGYSTPGASRLSTCLQYDVLGVPQGTSLLELLTGPSTCHLGPSVAACRSSSALRCCGSSADALYRMRPDEGTCKSNLQDLGCGASSLWESPASSRCVRVAVAAVPGCTDDAANKAGTHASSSSSSRWLHSVTHSSHW